MKPRLVVALAVVVLSLACQRESAAPEVPAPGQATAETVIATEDASTAVLDVKIPITVNAVARCEPSKTSFAMNEPVTLTLELNEVPDGLQVAARILDRNERLVARASEAANGRKSITLTVKGDVPEPGSYKLEGLWGGNIVCEHPIEFKR